MTRKNNVTAIILAGGLGTRLRPVTDAQKVIVPIQDKPFIFFLLDQLDKFNFHELIICTGYQSNQVKVNLGNTYKQLQIQFSEEEKPLGTAGAARKALEFTNAPNLLIMNGDSFCDVNLNEFHDAYTRSKNSVCIVVTRVQDVSRYGHIEIDHQSRITAFVEKSLTQQDGWISAGIYLMKRNLLENLPSNKKMSFEYEVLPQWLDLGIYAFQHQGRFIDIGTPESLQAAQSFFKGK